MSGLTMADFFAGIGGVSLAAEWAGFEVVAHCEIDPFCQRVLKRHWPHTPILEDICDVTATTLRAASVGHLDLAHFSLPCQGLSIAGKQKGTADPRYLWDDTRRIIAEVRPTVVTLENVDNAAAMVLDDWIADLADIGYAAGSVVVPAAAVEAPHLRYRLFVVGYAESVCERSGLRPNEPAPFGRRRSGDAGGEALADSRCDDRERWGESGVLAGAAAEGTGEAQERKRLRDASGHSRSAMAYADVNDVEGRGSGRSVPPGGTDRCRTGGEKGQSAQSRVGRDSARLSHWLDRSGLVWPGWPALPGQAQHDYEPPRTGGDKRKRRLRLRALGNAVVPAQVYPILSAIHAELMAAQLEEAG